MKKIPLKTFITGWGDWELEVSAFNEEGEGPKTALVVPVNYSSYTVDNNDVQVKNRLGGNLQGITNCGDTIQLLSSTDQQLPDSIEIRGVANFTYTRDSKDWTKAIVELDEVTGDQVEIIIGDLKDWTFNIIDSNKEMVASYYVDDGTEWRNLANTNPDLFVRVSNYIYYTTPDMAYQYHTIKNWDGKNSQGDVYPTSAIQKGATYIISYDPKTYNAYITSSNGYTEIYSDECSDGPITWKEYIDKHEDHFKYDSENHAYLKVDDRYYLIQHRTLKIPVDINWRVGRAMLYVDLNGESVVF